MKLKLSKHAAFKIQERRITLENIEKVLENPEFIFYDILSKSFISIGKIKSGKIETNLIVVYKKEADATKIITAYPCKNVDKEIKRKEEIRWIRIK